MGRILAAVGDVKNRCYSFFFLRTAAPPAVTNGHEEYVADNIRRILQNCISPDASALLDERETT